MDQLHVLANQSTLIEMSSCQSNNWCFFKMTTISNSVENFHRATAILPI